MHIHVQVLITTVRPCPGINTCPHFFVLSTISIKLKFQIINYDINITNNTCMFTLNKVKPVLTKVSPEIVHVFILFRHVDLFAQMKCVVKRFSSTYMCGSFQVHM